jgi:hypothetical protein
MHVNLQGGRFDHAGRLFWSVRKHVEDLYRNIQPQSWECPSEFFSFWVSLLNENEFDLGDQNPPRGDVELPAWARSPCHFVTVMRLALEGGHVSAGINRWLDLIFGIFRQARAGDTAFPPCCIPSQDRLYPQWCYPEDKFKDEDGSFSRTEEYGSFPLKLFEKEHIPRFGFARETFSCIDSFTLPLLAMVKEYMIFRDGTFVPFSDLQQKRSRNQPLQLRKLPPGTYFGVFGISRSQKIAVFGSGADNALSTVNLDAAEDQEPKVLIHKFSIITCGAVIGGEYLLVGGSDCAIHVYRLPELTHVSRSAFHSAPILAIAGNLDLGLVASIDSDLHLVLETLFDHKFINFATLQPVHSSKKPLVAVFKSGVITAGHEKRLTFYDSRALFMAKIDLTAPIVQIAKYYDVDKRELLIVACTAGTIFVVDLTTFQILEKFDTGYPSPQICPIKRMRYCPTTVKKDKTCWTLLAIDFAPLLSSVMGNAMN